MRARLLKAHVQAIFVIDDDDSLAEWVGPVVEVPGKDWRQFAADSFGPDDLESVLRRYTADAESANR